MFNLATLQLAKRLPGLLLCLNLTHFPFHLFVLLLQGQDGGVKFPAAPTAISSTANVTAISSIANVTAISSTANVTTNSSTANGRIRAQKQMHPSIPILLPRLAGRHILESVHADADVVAVLFSEDNFVNFVRPSKAQVVF